MSFQIKKATRVGISPLIVAYSESGCGKTYSALLLARGLAGPSGKIVVADSESRRASLYADVIPGGFETFDLGEPFTPMRYVEAIDEIESSGAAVGVIDSGSHEWEGPGGVLDMAVEIEKRSGKTGLHCWREPKFEHAKFVQRLLRIKIPIIVCLRAKYKSRQTKENGKTVIVKDETTSPIQAEDFIFEATCHFEILPNHSMILTKCSHPSLRDCFPADKTTPITIEHGQKLAAWCAAAGKPMVAKPADDLKALKAKLWNGTKAIHGGDRATLEQHLWDESFMTPNDSLDNLTAEQIKTICGKKGIQ
jgi:hypothetical protein